MTWPCGLYRHCIYNDSNMKMYTALIFFLHNIHYHTLYQNIIILPENEAIILKKNYMCPRTFGQPSFYRPILILKVIAL